MPNLILSRSFTIIFILLASFVFLSMFVGVMIIHGGEWHAYGDWRGGGVVVG